ncbi:hypothetical protein E3Q23_03875 [Wallemia mellicola]|uniref:Velvet domain-containing protein n=1 Tax=Wallemia mellicola TaxID=1708541 RepID=A0A4T0M8U3_9BASI|nr:hypothetical protein E3Q24_04125 [Wallemia mellicola]TIB71220.1 hypothetical protein E3Q23_03875 [Wallemia mellicola]TIB79325.1 hypothetical protein E3Q21_04188 [Wallemia mellicola]TIB83457.1 hypothetical protein E3Q20_04159 [Wallemia mellicola]TIB95672.1 hypothetical protein E3Q17_04206 [Wallemia mellicola]
MRKLDISINEMLSIEKEPRRYELIILQQPEVSRRSMLNDKERRCVDPPPILQLKIYDRYGRLDDDALRSPYWVVHSSLATHTPLSTPLQQSQILQGLLTSSAHYCTRTELHDSGSFFHFSDLSFTTTGVYQLKFTLTSVYSLPIFLGELPTLAEAISNPIRVYTPKDFPGMAQSTPLAKSLAEQSVLIPIRNENHRIRQ